MAQPAVEIDPKALMDEAVNVVKQQAFQMKRALDQNNVREGLKFCTNMLCELRTGQITPKQCVTSRRLPANLARNLMFVP